MNTPIYSKGGQVIYRTANPARELVINPENSITEDANSDNYLYSQDLELEFRIYEQLDETGNLKTPKSIDFILKTVEQDLSDEQNMLYKNKLSDYDIASSARFENSKKLDTDFQLNYDNIDENGNKYSKARAIQILPLKEYLVSGENPAKINDTLYSLLQKGLSNQVKGKPYKINSIDGTIEIGSSDENYDELETDKVLLAGVTDGSFPEDIKDKVNRWNYSMRIKADVEGVGNGYRILINSGVADEGSMFDMNKDISGYMFEYNPQMGGFVVRGTKPNAPSALDNVNKSYGVLDESGNPFIYRPEDITNKNFRFDGDYTNQASTWYDPHYVNVKVITNSGKDKKDWEDADDKMDTTIVVTIEDINGNKSEPMYFGDFGSRTLANGKVIKNPDKSDKLAIVPRKTDGTRTKYSNTADDPMMGMQSIRSSDGMKNGYVTYSEVSFGQAPPDAVDASYSHNTVKKDDKTTINQYEVDVKFNKDLNSSAVTPDDFKIQVGSTIYDVENVSISGDSMTLKLPDTADTINLKDGKIIYDIKDGTTSNFTDSKGNVIDEFTYKPQQIRQK